MRYPLLSERPSQDYTTDLDGDLDFRYGWGSESDESVESRTEVDFDTFAFSVANNQVNGTNAFQQRRTLLVIFAQV